MRGSDSTNNSKQTGSKQKMLLKEWGSQQGGESDYQTYFVTYGNILPVVYPLFVYSFLNKLMYN
jgi:hypothetical protein